MAPITLANTKIGDLQLHGFDPDKAWDQSEMALIEAVLDQVAQSAENLRLFEETRERADYERLIGEITQKIRQAPNFDVLARVAGEEVGRVLGVSSGRVTLKITQPQTKAETNGHNDAPQA